MILAVEKNIHGLFVSRAWPFKLPRAYAAFVYVAIALAILILPGQANSADKLQFNRDIRPILSDACFRCHGFDKQARQADLRLDTADGALAKRDDPQAIVPGKPEESEVIRRISSSDDDQRMPPPDSGKQLTADQMELIRRWIAEGAHWQPHWSFIPPARPDAPQVKNEKWLKNEVDRFILARLEREGLQPAPEADRRTLIRRLSFDLTGLPPTPEDTDAFEADPSADAYQKLVDRLLSSPHYGERMAMHWLDLVRYADTVGYHGDQSMNVSPYRDYVIQAFNSNLSFEQFTIEQLAGDLLPGATMWQKVATGFNRLNQTTEEGGAQANEYLAKYSADRVRAVSTVWMGATMGCAECHDHKFDPYSTKDFYSLAAFFADLDEKGVYVEGLRPPEMSVGSAEDIEELNRLNQKLATLNEASKNKRDQPQNDSDVAKLKEQITALEQQRSELQKRVRATLVSVSTKPREMRVLPRGNWMDETGEVVQPAVPHFMQPTAADGRLTRLDLGRWLTRPDHPQTARVFVNRLWKLFFGVGISRVLDDLGTQGEWPIHPELLDDLAIEFVESGWNVKHVVKLIVMSNAYRQSSIATEEALQRDPLNRLLARQSRWRIDAEMVRDNALAISGLLVRAVGGGSIRPYQPEGYYQFLNFPPRTYVADSGELQYRRGVYVHWQRTYLHPMLLAFDAPSREECTAERPISNTPKAALTLLNDPTFVEAARVFAEQILQHGGQSFTDRLKWAYRQALSRPPQPREVDLFERLYSRHLDHYTAELKAAEALVSVGQHPPHQNLPRSELAAWTSLSRVLLNLGETIFRE